VARQLHLPGAESIEDNRMPAINAAANPVNAVTSPSTPNSGSSASSANSGERPFAAVLAEQTGKAPKANHQDKSPAATDKARPTADGETEAAVLTTDSPLTPDVQGLIPPFVVAETVPADASVAVEGDSDTQAQTATELIQAVLMTAGTVPNPMQPDGTSIRPTRATGTLAAATTESVSIPGVDAGIEADPRGESMADMRLAVARSAHGETPPDNGSVPAKLAATRDVVAPPTEVRTTPPKEIFALPTENRAGPSTELLAAKSDTGMAQAAASMAATASMQVAAAAAQPRHGSEYQIVTPVGSQHWETAVGNSLVIMSGSRQDRAELVLTPPQFGRIEVSISMKGDEATAVFVSANPAVRDALESALPRLREVLAEAGITLGQTQVGAESQGQAASERQNGDNASRRGIADAVGDSQSQSGADSRTNTTHRVVSRSLVDTYA
jgi:flagellar hook-length control protein FliK